MPRKTKELSEEKVTKNSTNSAKNVEPKKLAKKETKNKVDSISKSTADKKTAVAKNTSKSGAKSTPKSSTKNTSKSSSKKVSKKSLDISNGSNKNEVVKKASVSRTSKSNTSKKTSSSKKTESKAASKSKKATTKTANSKKSTSKTATSKTSASKKGSTSKKAKKSTLNSVEDKETFLNNEYYDLPYRYNQTVVKVLAQTPNNLFIYWDISDEDRENLKKLYGENFFETTYPVLIVYNDTLNYSFEVSINDFANSWYLHVNDSKSDYRIELGRRPIDYYKFNENVKTVNNKITNDINYIHISTSNEIESPNDRILFNKEQKMVYYRNVKTHQTTSKPITSLSFVQNMGKIYNIYELYKQIYKEENIDDLYDLSNPSSGNPSSGQPSSSSFR